jgi:hypothetical protein
LSSKNGITITSILEVFIGAIVGLALTPTIVSLVEIATAGMAAGAAKTLLELFTMFWVIFLTAIPVGSVVLYAREKAKSGTMSLGDIVGIFLPSVVGLALTPTVTGTVTNTTVNMSAGATKTLLELFPMFWVIYLIGIPVTAIAIWFYFKSKK